MTTDQPCPGRSDHAELRTYVPAEATDPVGFQMDQDLAAAIRQIRADTGASGNEAYAAAYRQLMDLAANDPVPAISDLPWRQAGQWALDLEGGVVKDRTVGTPPTEGCVPVLDLAHDTFLAAPPHGPYTTARRYTCAEYQADGGDVARLAELWSGPDAEEMVALATAYQANLAVVYEGDNLDDRPSIQASAWAASGGYESVFIKGHEVRDAYGAVSAGTGIEDLLRMADGDTDGWTTPKVPIFNPYSCVLVGVVANGRVVLNTDNMSAIATNTLAQDYFGVSADDDGRVRIRSRDSTPQLVRPSGGLSL